MKALTMSEIACIDGGSTDRAFVVSAATVVGADVGLAFATVAGAAVGAVAGAISAGAHAPIIWNYLK